MRFDIIAIGTVTVDQYLHYPDMVQSGGRGVFQIGEKYFAHDFHVSLGGGATNVAIGCAKQGLKVKLIAEIGNTPLKYLIFEHLDMHAVNRTDCITTPGFTNLSTILLDRHGEKIVFNYRSPSSELLAAPLPAHALRNTRVVFLGNVPELALEKKIQLCTDARAAGVCTALVLGTRDCARARRSIQRLLDVVDILVVNRHEFAILMQLQETRLSLATLHSRTLPLRMPDITIVTDGANGSYGYIAEEIIHQPALAIDRVVDTTGAGDGYTAGFITGYLDTHDVAFAMRHAAAYARKILGKLGAN